MSTAGRRHLRKQFAAAPDRADAPPQHQHAAERIGRLDEDIASTVATSATGIIGQVRVLYELGEGEYGADDDYHDPGGGARLRDTIIAGIERLARGAVI